MIKHLLLLMAALVIIGVIVAAGVSGKIYPRQCFPILVSNQAAFHCTLK